MFLFEKVIINSISHNLEGVNYWRKADITALEKVQAKLLKTLLKLPESTPYWGILNEVGIWPLEHFLHYKKFMLLQNLITSDDSRTTKNLIIYQRKYEIEASWYNNLEKIGKQYEIQMTNEELLLNKPAWKKHVKEQINRIVVEKSKKNIESMTKLRHQKDQSFIMQDYIKETNIWRIRDLLRVKLELLDIGRNQGNNRICCGCGQADETTEHVIVCEQAKELVGGDNKANLDMMSDRHSLLHLYNYLTSYIKRRNEMQPEDKNPPTSQQTIVAFNSPSI